MTLQGVKCNWRFLIRRRPEKSGVFRLGHIRRISGILLKDVLQFLWMGCVSGSNLLSERGFFVAASNAKSTSHAKQDMVVVGGGGAKFSDPPVNGQNQRINMNGYFMRELQHIYYY